MRTLTYLTTLATLLALAGACSSGSQHTATTNSDAALLVADPDIDEHGCKGSAGYQWSAVQQRCVQLTQTAIKLDAGEGPVAYLLFASPDNDERAEVFLPGQPGRVLTRKPGDGAGTWTLDTLTLSQWKGMYTLNGAKGTVLHEGHYVPADDAEADAGESLKPGQDVPTMLAGTWQRVDDPTERFTVAGKTLTRSTNGKKGPALTVTYVPDCAGTACAGHESPYGCLTTAGEFDIDCQTIGVITPTDLALSVGSTETVVRYRKTGNQ